MSSRSVSVGQFLILIMGHVFFLLCMPGNLSPDAGLSLFWVLNIIVSPNYS